MDGGYTVLGGLSGDEPGPYTDDQLIGMARSGEIVRGDGRSRLISYCVKGGAPPVPPLLEADRRRFFPVACLWDGYVRAGG